MKKFMTLAAATLLCLTASAQKTVTFPKEASGADETIRVWDNTTAPHSNCETKDEKVVRNHRLSNTSATDFYLFKADPAKATGHSVAIFPGGAYRTVNLSFGYARYLADCGITAMVVKYRVPNFGHWEVPLEDAMEAVRWLRRNAERLGIDPAKVGVTGSSAGGHLAAWVSNAMPDGEKPAFAVLHYPVIDGTIFSSKSQNETLRHLLGNDRTTHKIEQFGVDRMVTPTTPPTLILHSYDDHLATVNNSIAYYKALKRQGVCGSLHFYPEGNHGWVSSTKFHYVEHWHNRMVEWIRLH